MSRDALKRTFPRLEELKMPVRVIAGELDASVPPPSMRGIADEISGASFQIIQKAPHLLGVEMAKELAQAIAG